MVLDASHVESWQLAKTGNKYNIQRRGRDKSSKSGGGGGGGVTTVVVVVVVLILVGSCSWVRVLVWVCLFYNNSTFIHAYMYM